TYSSKAYHVSFWISPSSPFTMVTSALLLPFMTGSLSLSSNRAALFPGSAGLSTEVSEWLAPTSRPCAAEKGFVPSKSSSETRLASRRFAPSAACSVSAAAVRGCAISASSSPSRLHANVAIAASGSASRRRNILVGAAAGDCKVCVCFSCCGMPRSPCFPLKGPARKLDRFVSVIVLYRMVKLCELLQRNLRYFGPLLHVSRWPSLAGLCLGLRYDRAGNSFGFRPDFCHSNRIKCILVFGTSFYVF